jgi:hypothetical protein
MVYYRWWGDWRFFQPEEYLSMLELVRAGSLDLRLAALLWMLMEKRTSVLVASGPSFAGKTTFLNALLDFLPPQVSQVHLQGNYEAVRLVQEAAPDQTYMVADEISNHLYGYVWGEIARKVFGLLPLGHALGGAMHARNAREALEVLHYALGLPLTVLAWVRAVINLRAAPGRNFDEEPIRYVEAVSLVSPANEGISIEIIAARRSKEEGIEFMIDRELESALSAVIGSREGGIMPEIARREIFLGNLMKGGALSREELRKAVLDFYASRKDVNK